MIGRERLWYGRSPVVSRQLVFLGFGLFVLTTAVFFTDVNTLWPAPLATSGILLLVGLAAIEAYYNEGVLIAWLLTFALTLPAFIFYPPRGPRFAVSPATAPTAIAKAGAIAVLLGTVGFVIGLVFRRRRDRDRDNDYVPSTTILPHLFVGRDIRVTARWLLVAAVEFVVLFMGAWLGLLPFWPGFAGAIGVVALLVVMAGPATISAIRNGGVLVSWLLSFAPLFGVFLALQVGATIEPAPNRPVLYALGTSLLFALPVGTAGFLGGLGIRRVHRHLGTPPEPNASPD